MVINAPWKLLQKNKKRKILNLINKTYPVGKYFNENFGYIFGDKIITVHSNPFAHEWNKGQEYQYDGLMSSCYQEKDLWISEYQGEIEIGEHSNGYRTMFCHFDEEGNYVNRDYNFNIVYQSKQTSTTLKKALADFSKLIPKGGYMRKGDFWYGETAAFKIIPLIEEDKENKKESKPHGFMFARYNSNGKGTYVSARYKRDKFKMPKGVQESSREELMDKIEQNLRDFGFQNSY